MITLSFHLAFMLSRQLLHLILQALNVHPKLMLNANMITHIALKLLYHFFILCRYHYWIGRIVDAMCESAPAFFKVGVTHLTTMVFKSKSLLVRRFKPSMVSCRLLHEGEVLHSRRHWCWVIRLVADWVFMLLSNQNLNWSFNILNKCSNLHLLEVILLNIAFVGLQIY